MLIRIYSIKSVLLITFILLFNYSFAGRDNLFLYTPYTKISVPPGESIDYTIDVYNKSSEILDANIYVTGIPGSWNYSLKAGGWSVSRISVFPDKNQTITLNIEVPLKVKKGNYFFEVVAGDYSRIPITVHVSEQGTYKTEFTSDQINMQGHAKSNFTFNTKLTNHTGEKQLYSLRSNAPRGWNVIFKPNYKQATAVELDPNASSNITIEITPPVSIKAGTYKLPVQASTGSTSAELVLEGIITGSYEMELTTPTGLLSTDITAGKEKRIDLLLKNTGSTDLNHINFKASKPSNWEVVFDPDTVYNIAAGGTSNITALIKAYDKAIPGDYVTNITAHTDEATSSISMRISVKTPILWGWLGILIILGAIVSVWYLFRKYGRR